MDKKVKQNLLVFKKTIKKENSYMDHKDTDGYCIRTKQWRFKTLTPDSP